MIRLFILAFLSLLFLFFLPTKTEAAPYCIKVPVLMYHHVQPLSQIKQKGEANLTVDSAVFEKQMTDLQSRGYTAISAKELVDALRTRSPLPHKSVVITLDDGYSDIYTYAYPVFTKLGMKANLVISTGLIGNPHYLTWEQVKEMGGSGLISYVNHTWSHYALVKGPTDKITFEVETAKKQLAEYAGQTIDVFAYPYGTSTSTVHKILQEQGFAGAFSTIPGFTQCDSFLLTLRRNRIGNGHIANYGL